MKQLEVKILQQSYLLGCQPGQEERLMDAVRMVDSAMTRIHDSGKVRARERIAVLAALNLAFELGDLRTAARLAAAAQQPPADTGLSAATQPEDREEADSTLDSAADSESEIEEAQQPDPSELERELLTRMVENLDRVLAAESLPGHDLQKDERPEAGT